MSMRQKNLLSEKKVNARIRSIDLALAEDKEKPKMDETMFRDIYDSLSVIEKIVFEAVPIDQPARFQQVIFEVRRANKSSYPQKIIESALQNLVKSGIVVETSKEVYVREVVFLSSENKNMSMIQTDPEDTLITRDIFKNLYEKAEKLSADVDSFKFEIQKTAEMIDKRIADSQQVSREFIQLKSLLKGIIK